MDVLTGIDNFLNFVNENWTMITSIITIGIIILKKAKSYLNLSKEEQIRIAKAQISEIMLMLVTDAECSYIKWQSAGAIKRSEVIDKVFAMYPVLSKMANQEEIIGFIDETIDEALKTMRKIFEENKEKSESVDIA